MVFLIYFIILSILLGILPSIIWLLFYLRKDAHPESNSQIIKIFLYGMLITIPVILIEVGFSKGLNKLMFIPLPPLLFLFLKFFVGVAFIEEIGKYLVVKWGEFKNPELDEPVDVMLYMIIAGLGFVAVENIFLTFSSLKSPSLVLSILIGRFISATFLHALTSGSFGYFLALSFLKTKIKKRLFFLSGLLLAVLLHGFYNYAIIEIKPLYLKVISVIFILSFLAFLVSWGFYQLKRIKSICNLE